MNILLKLYVYISIRNVDECNVIFAIFSFNFL